MPTNNEKFKDQVAIITGAARGIGRVLANRLSDEGAKVIVADLLDAKVVVDEVREKGGEAIEVRTDVTKWDSIQAMVSKTIERYC